MNDAAEVPVDDGTQRFQKELLAGTVSLLLLSLLERAGEPLYGYEIAKLFERARETGPEIKRGTLYPALRSLEKRGYLQSEVVASETGPPRRYYTITSAGRGAASSWRDVWLQTQEMVRSVLSESQE